MKIQILFILVIFNGMIGNAVSHDDYKNPQLDAEQAIKKMTIAF